MRGGERLVQVQVQDVESHIAWTGHADERVHIRSIIVEKASASVDEGGDLLYVLLEESEGVRVRHHDAGDVVAQKRFEVVHVHETVCLGLNDNHFQTADSGAGRVCTVRTVRNDNLGTFGIASEKVILTHDHKAGKFSVSTCTWVECKSCHTCDGCQRFFHVPVYFQCSLHGRFRLERMETEEARHCCHFFIDLRIIFHRTAAERIESGIDTEVHLRQIRIMAYYIHFTYLRQSKFRLACKSLGNSRSRSENILRKRIA